MNIYRVKIDSNNYYIKASSLRVAVNRAIARIERGQKPLRTLTIYAEFVKKDGTV